MATSTPALSPAPRPRRIRLFAPRIGIVEAFAKEVTLIHQAPLFALKAFIEVGQELDEPIVLQPAASPAE